jgi:hypothetical protein
MDPADDPEEFIAASIYWYPLMFPTRTEVLDHTFLGNGNGYEWDADGKIASRFAHIEPDYDRWYSCEADASRFEAEAQATTDQGMRDLLLSWAARDRAEGARLQAIRDDYLHLARTYGPVRVREQVPGPGNANVYQARTMAADYVSRWTLLGRAPEYVDPAWAVILSEVRELFASLFTEQGALWADE